MNRSAFRFPQPANPLRFDGERFVSGLLGNASSGDIQSEHYHRYLFALQVCGGKDVLDIASGEGYGSHCLGQVARSVVGVDANAEAVDFANQNYLTECVSFKLGRAQSIPIVDASIDVVVSFETLEHFKEHEAFASEVRRVLRPGGLLLISSPNRTVYSDEANYRNEWHLRELDRNEFVSYLAASFANVRMFAQRPMTGSVIAVDDAASSGGRPEGFILRGENLFHRTDGVPHPPFFVAFASDDELPQVRSSLLQNPTLLRHIDLQRQTASDDAARAVAQVAELENALAKAMQESSAQAVALASSRNENAVLIAELDDVRTNAAQCKAEAEQASSAVGLTARQEAADVRRQLNLLAQSAERIQTVRQELTAARRRNVELAEEADALRRERDELTSEADSLRGERDELNRKAENLGRERDARTSETGSLRRERDARISEAESLRRERDARTSEAESLRRERDARMSEAESLRWERDELTGETASLRGERDHYQRSLDSIRGSTTWRATWALRRVGSILPPRLRHPLRSGATTNLPWATSQRDRAGGAGETSDPVPLALPPSQPATDQAVEICPSDLRQEGDECSSKTDRIQTTPRTRH